MKLLIDINKRRRRSYLLTPEGRALLDQEYRRICRQAEDYRRCFEGSDQG